MSSFMPAELVRRAAAGVTSTVSSTVSSVASAASGKKRHESQGGGRHSFYEANLISNAKEKYTMTVKCTPNKDAATTADLSVKSGFLMKRNEQGNWQKRFLCIVPHMFLYYFDNELAEAPRGIIDLELYQQTEREDSGTIRLVAVDETLRSFHFGDEDAENLNEWATSLIRDRYHLVCEERNAYQQMQSLMTGAIDNASSAQKTSEKEREQLEKNLSAAENSFLEARRVLQSTLVELGISEEEISQLTDVPKIGISLKNRITDIRNSYDRKLQELHEMMNAQQSEYGKMTEEFLKKMENEQLARKNLEALILKERKESEKKIKEAEAQIDNITLNFQMAVAAKTTSETKVNTLTDQKKLLVKEVKQLRKRVDELAISNDELKALNDKLLKAATALQFTLKSSASSSPKTVPVLENTSIKESAVFPPNSVAEDGINGTGSLEENVTGTDNTELEDLLTYTDQLIAKSEILNHTTERRSFDSHLNGNGEDSSQNSRTPNSSNPIHRAMNLFRSTGSDNDLQEKASDRQFSDEKSRNNSVVEDFEERPSWEMPPMALRELGWLSEEQNKLMEKRLGEAKEESHSNSTWSGVSAAAFKRSASEEPSHNVDSRHGSKRLSMLTSLLGTNNNPSNTSAGDNTQNPSPHTSGRRSSLMALTSMFKKEKALAPALAVDESNANSPATHTANTKPVEDLFFSSPFTSNADEEDRLPTAMRLHCLRCNGTVEGPKFSTCKCSTPALTPEDISNDRLSSFTGIFKGGILKATGLYGSQTANNTSTTPSIVPHNTNEITL